jgi:hypothetical protein
MQSDELVHAIDVTTSFIDHGIASGVLHEMPASEEKEICDAALTPPAVTAAHDDVPKQLSDRTP